MGLAFMINIVGLMVWLGMTEFKVKEIKGVASSSLLKAPYIELIYSAVVFPIIVYHLKIGIDNLKRLKAREEFLY